MTDDSYKEKPKLPPKAYSRVDSFIQRNWKFLFIAGLIVVFVAAAFLGSGEGFDPMNYNY